MGVYLDRLTTEYDELTRSTDELLVRAADENRDLTDDENKIVERDNKRAEELKKSIEYHAGIEESRAKVATLRSKVPSTPRQQGQQSIQVIERDDDPEKALLREFPTAGDYIVTAGRAFRGDKEAIEKLERATQHQTTADNPGLLPRPIVGPLITAVSNDRPFISSISQKALPTQKFDRPVITQHVGVGIQAAEKDLTESRKLLIDKLPVEAKTFAGHLNVSRQDIKWSTPSLMQIIAEDFAHEYAIETDGDAIAGFIASLTNTPIAIDDPLSAASVTSAIFAASAASMTTAEGAPLPDTLWVSPDAWGAFGSLVNNNGSLVFPSVTPTSSAGNLLGLRLVVDGQFPAGTAVVGASRFLEWFEDVDGLMQVAEPDVQGQLVGYAGFGAFLNTKPDLFTSLTLPTTPAALTAAKSSSK